MEYVSLKLFHINQQHIELDCDSPFEEPDFGWSDAYAYVQVRDYITPHVSLPRWQLQEWVVSFTPGSFLSTNIQF